MELTDSPDKWELLRHVDRQVPQLSQILLGEGVDLSLALELEQMLCSGDVLQRMQALGLLVRSWTPPRATEEIILFYLEEERGIPETLVESTPVARAIAWFRAQGPAFWREIETLALESLDLLRDSILAGNPWSHARLQWRDDLESVRCLLQHVDRGARLSRELSRTDRIYLCPDSVARGTFPEWWSGRTFAPHEWWGRVRINH